MEGFGNSAEGPTLSFSLCAANVEKCRVVLKFLAARRKLLSHRLGTHPKEKFCFLLEGQIEQIEEEE